MATRMILRVKQGKNYKDIYHHYDGYPENIAKQINEANLDNVNIDTFIDIMNDYEIKNFNVDKGGYEKTNSVHGDIDYAYYYDIDNQHARVFKSEYGNENEKPKATLKKYSQKETDPIFDDFIKSYSDEKNLEEMDINDIRNDLYKTVERLEKEAEKNANYKVLINPYKDLIEYFESNTFEKFDSNRLSKKQKPMLSWEKSLKIYYDNFKESIGEDEANRILADLVDKKLQGFSFIGDHFLNLPKEMSYIEKIANILEKETADFKNKSDIMKHLIKVASENSGLTKKELEDKILNQNINQSKEEQKQDEIIDRWIERVDELDGMVKYVTSSEKEASIALEIKDIENDLFEVQGVNWEIDKDLYKKIVDSDNKITETISKKELAFNNNTSDNEKISLLNNDIILLSKTSRELQYEIIALNEKNGLVVKKPSNSPISSKPKNDLKTEEIKSVNKEKSSLLKEKENINKSVMEGFIEDLMNNIDKPETEKELLDFFDQVAELGLSNYSIQNIKLAHDQARAVGIRLVGLKSFKQWKEMGVSVNKGEKSFKIKAPKILYEIEKDDSGKYIKNEKGGWKYKLDGEGKRIKSGVSFIDVPVFDASQTNAKELGVMPQLDYRSNVSVNPDLYDTFANEIKTKYGVMVEEREKLGNTGGYYNPLEKIIVINSDNSVSHKISTLFHELGHHRLHGQEITTRDDYEKIHSNRGLKEGEAESVSYILSRMVGIENKSELYLKTWGNDRKSLSNSFKKIFDVVKEIQDNIDFNTILENHQEQKYNQNQELKNYVKEDLEKNGELTRVSSIAPDLTAQEEEIKKETLRDKMKKHAAKNHPKIDIDDIYGKNNVKQGLTGGFEVK